MLQKNLRDVAVLRSVQSCFEFSYIPFYLNVSGRKTYRQMLFFKCNFLSSAASFLFLLLL